VAPVSPTAVNKLLNVPEVDFQPFGLVGYFTIPLQAQPLHGGNNGISVLLGRALRIGVLNP
jgi:hypothetical protein